MQIFCKLSKINGLVDMAGTWKHGNAMKIICDGKGKNMNIELCTPLCSNVWKFCIESVLY